jgi:predicted outer membrane repeat protein
MFANARRWFQRNTPRSSRPGPRRPRRLAVELLEDRLAPAVFNVLSTADSNGPVITAGHAGTAADPFLAPSLRSAISAANATPGGNTINLTAGGTYQITLAGTPGETDNRAGEFAILPAGGDLTIQNTSGFAVAIDGNHLNRVFDINPNFDPAHPTPKFTVTLTGLTVENGFATDNANPDGPNASGGGIRDTGNASLTLNNVVVTNNNATADGGGIVFENTVSVPWTLTTNNTVISNNHAGDAGGGIDTDGSGKVFINAGTVIAGNTSVNQGAGIWLDAIQVGTVFQTANLTVTGAVISGNSALASLGGGIGNAGNGTVLIQDSTLANNFAQATGGGFGDENAQGTLTVQNSLFLGNSAVGSGGAIAAGGPSTTITNSEIKGNSTGANGGGLFANGVSLTVLDSTFAGNTAAANGGGLEVETTGTGAQASTVTNTTVAGNSALNNGAGQLGGGIDVGNGGNFTGTLTLLNDTINANFAFSGGGLAMAHGGTVNLQNTIVAGNHVTNAGTDLVTTNGTHLTSQGGNLIGILDAGGLTPLAADQTGTAAAPLNPLLGPLGNNGGPTVGAGANAITLETEALLPGSPAVGKGLAGAPAQDERGLLHPSYLSTTSDVGAFDTHAVTPTIASTVPGNGDVNPYGVFFVPQGFPAGGALQPGDLLVANFNNAANTQGLGTTIVKITPGGQPTTFFTSQQLGLDDALAVLKAGFVVVGNVPNTDGNGTPGAGSLQFIDGNGNLVKTLTDANLLNGPWGLAVNDQGSTVQLFVSNVLSGTVTRINLSIQGGTITVTGMTQIASGYTHKTDPNAFVIGPAGLAYDAAHGVLYVASQGENAIYKIANAGTATTDGGKGTLLVQDTKHLHGPLELVLAPNGDLIVANSDGVNADPAQPSELVEYTTAGAFVGQFSVDPANGGAFGLGVETTAGGGAKLAAVNDNANTIATWDFEPGSISGSVFQDRTGGGQFSAGAGLSGVTVNLLGAGGAVLASTTTDVHGNYAFFNVAPGSYQVSVTPPNGSVLSTGPASVTVGGATALTATPLGLFNFATLSGTTLTITGTPRDDTVYIQLGTTDVVTFDGAVYSVAGAAVSAIDYVGNGGADSVSVFTTGTGNVASLFPHAGMVQGAGYTVNVQGVSTLNVNGGSTDRAYLSTSAGNDSFVGAPTYAYVSGAGFLEQVGGFGNVTAFAGGSGARAYLFDAPGDDIFVATPTFAYLYGSGFFNEASGFAHVTAYATAGKTDSAYLFDSPGDDVFVATPNFAYLYGTGYFNEVSGFDRVVANSRAGGNDVAFLYGAPGDVLVGTPTYSYLYSGNFFNEAAGFKSVHVTGGAQSVAYLYGAPTGNDSVVAQGNAAALSGQGYSISVDDFAQVVASLTGSGTHHKQVGAIDFFFSAVGNFS